MYGINTGMPEPTHLRNKLDIEVRKKTNNFHAKFIDNKPSSAIHFVRSFSSSLPLSIFRVFSCNSLFLLLISNRMENYVIFFQLAIRNYGTKSELHGLHLHSVELWPMRTKGDFFSK